ncbi:MAG: choice-of-anchor J domain-containing protein, partial [Psychroflexus sp.]
MKKITFLMMSFMMFAFGYAQDAIITGYVDSPCPGADGRTIEIYVNGTVDFTDWNLARQSNGGGFTTNVDLTSLGSLTDEFAYVTNDEATLDVEFTINSTTHNVIENSVISSNGDDAFQITDAGDVVVDRFGEENVDGTGTAWEHVDTYYYRNDGATANAGAFDPANWTFGTQDALDNLGNCNFEPALSNYVPFGSYMSTVVAPGESCANPIAITGLPYTTSDDTANYGNNYNNGDSPCDSFYLSGDEAIYAFTPANNMAVNISLYNVSVDYSAIHVLDACLDDSPNCVAFEGNSNSIDRNLEGVYLTGGQTYYIVISTWATPQSVQYELSIEEITCPAPTDVVLSNITQTSADVSWTSFGSETEWEILYDETGFDPLVDGTSVIDNDGTLGETLSGLTTGTTYDVYVRAMCSATDMSDWTAVATFSTACDVINTAYTEDFESVSSLPACWSVINQGGANEWVFESSPDGGAQSGDNVMKIRYNSSAHDDYLIMPATEVIAGTTDMVSFSLRSRASSLLEPFEVVLSTTDNMSDTSFDEVLQAEMDAPDTWTQYEFDLSAYVGQTVYVAIRATGTNDFELFADDFVFDSPPSCIEPTDVVFSNITLDSADVSWTANGSETEWEILYGETGFDPAVDGTSVMDTDGTLGETLTGLVDGTLYDVYVRADCGSGDLSTWNGPTTFATECAVYSAAYTEDFESVSSLPACWSVINQGGANEWVFESSPNGGAQSGDNVMKIRYNSSAHDDY